MTYQLSRIIDEQEIFDPLTEVNDISGKYMSIEYLEDSIDGVFSRLSDYTRLINRVENYGVDELLIWLSSAKSKKRIVEGDGFKIVRDHKHSCEGTLIFDQPITVFFGKVGKKRITHKVSQIKGEFTYEWGWLKNGRQNKVANSIELYFDCKEFVL